MALVIKDRISETTTTSGTSDLTLGGATPGYQSFAVIGDTNTVYYCITDGNSWEVGLGTYSTTGPTLARTTVYSNSLGTTAKISLTVGVKNVFAVYPAEGAVTVDIPNGTIQVPSNGILPVANGGTGVNTSTGANSVVIRTPAQLIEAQNFSHSYATTATAGATTYLVAASAYWQSFTGSANQTVRMPDATTIPVGLSFVIDNDSTGTLTIQDYSGGSITTIASGAVNLVYCDSVSTSAGVWDAYGWLPDNVKWGDTAADLGGVTFSNGTWQGNVIGVAYGGTGSATATFSGANITSLNASNISTGTIANARTTADSANGASTIVARDASGNFSAATITANLTGTASNATVLQTARAIYGNNFDGSAALTQVIASTYGGTGNGFTKFSGPTTAEKTFTLPDASATILTSNTAVTVAQGGTGQTTYTDGQLLIGNTTGNTLTKATLTGTANQIIVTNGGGSITLSAPQSINTASSVQFGSFGVGTAASGTTGEIRATNNVTAYYSSDRRFKENIRPIQNALASVDAIGGVMFDWTDEYIKEHGGEDGYFVQKEDFGVIAQDVQQVFPQAIRVREDGSLAVDYSKLVALAFAAIKELKERIEKLEA